MQVFPGRFSLQQDHQNADGAKPRQEKQPGGGVFIFGLLAQGGHAHRHADHQRGHALQREGHMGHIRDEGDKAHGDQQKQEGVEIQIFASAQDGIDQDGQNIKAQDGGDVPLVRQVPVGIKIEPYAHGQDGFDGLHQVVFDPQGHEAQHRQQVQQLKGIVSRQNAGKPPVHIHADILLLRQGVGQSKARNKHEHIHANAAVAIDGVIKKREIGRPPGVIHDDQQRHQPHDLAAVLADEGSIVEI